MSDPFLNKLHELENSIYNFSEVFGILLKRLFEVINGTSANRSTDELIEELIRHLANIKEHMHKYIDEIYADTNFENKSKHYHDMVEQLALIKDLNNIFNKLK
jgi:hypothetical protein